MSEFVLLTAVGRDRPGIVAAVSEVLWRAGCNLEDASMTLLRGEFAVLLIAKRPPELTTDALASQLQALADRTGLQITVKELSPQESEPLPRVGRPYAIHVYGKDRTGIVHQISSLLAARGVNITDVNTRVLTGSGTPVYVMLLEIDLPPTVEESELRTALEAAARSLGVDFSLQAVDEEAL